MKLDCKLEILNMKIGSPYTNHNNILCKKLCKSENVCSLRFRYFIYGMQDSQHLERVRLEFIKFEIPKGEKVGE